MENAHYFLHVTDTHLCFDAEAPDICCTEQALRSLYQTAFAWDHRPAFVLITGDLVHEGTSADYARAKTLLQELDGCRSDLVKYTSALQGMSTSQRLTLFNQVPFMAGWFHKLRSITKAVSDFLTAFREQNRVPSAPKSEEEK